MQKKVHKSKFIQGIAVLMCSQVIVKLIGMIYKLYVTNKQGFGDTGNALFAASFQAYATFLIFSSVGIPNTISQMVSERVAIGDNKGAYRIFKIAFAIFGFIGFIGSAILYFYAKPIAKFYLNIEETEIILKVLAPSIFLVAISSVIKGYCNGREKIVVTAKSQTIEQLLKTVITIIFIEIISRVSDNNTVLMAAMSGVATTISIGISFIYLYTFFIKNKKDIWRELICSKEFKKEGALAIIKAILKTAIPIILCGLVSSLNKTIDALTIVKILKQTIGEEAATIQYGILTGKIETLISLPFAFNMAFSTALIPTISSEIARRNVKVAKRKIEISMLSSILIGLPCSIVLFTLAKPILKFLFPNASSGATMLQISSWNIILVLLIQTINGTMQGLKDTKNSIIAFGVGSIIKLILNIVLLRIEKIGINGAIIATIISDFVVLIILTIKLKKKINISFDKETAKNYICDIYEVIRVKTPKKSLFLKNKD